MKKALIFIAVIFLSGLAGYGIRESILMSCPKCEFWGYKMPCDKAMELHEQKEKYLHWALQDQELYPGGAIVMGTRINMFMMWAAQKEAGLYYPKDTLDFANVQVILE